MKQINDVKKQLIAKTVSSLTHAPFYSIPAFLIINYFESDMPGFILSSLICILFSAVIPVYIVIYWTKRIKSHEKDLPNKEDRIIPLIIGVLSYLTGAGLLLLMNAPLLSIALMFCYGTNTLIVTIISKFWKISIHAMGVMGPTVAMIFAFGLPGAIYGIILPIVMWSRSYLNKHTMGQLFAGAAGGFILTAVQIYLILKYGSVDVYVPDIGGDMMWLAYAFVGPCLFLSVAGYLNHRGVKAGYTRIFCGIFGFVSLAAFVCFASAELSVIFIIIGIIYLGISCIAREGFLWYDGICRKSDSLTSTKKNKNR
jgi:hypothetical protein